MGQPTYDIQASCRSGQNFNDTDGIVGNSYLAGLNVRPYGDDLLPRYPNRSLELIFPEGSKGAMPFTEIFSKGNPQAVIPFKEGLTKSLIIIINGTWFKVNLNSLSVDVLNYKLGEAKLSDNLQAVNWEVINKAVIVFDGDLPLIYDGNEIRRANLDAKYSFVDAQDNVVVQAVPEALRSFIGVYDNLRLWIAVGSNVLAASDELGSGPPNAPLAFSQSFTDAGEYTGQFPTLANSTTFEQITAIGSFLSQNPEGKGKLFASTQNKVYTIESQVPRAAWETTPGFVSQRFEGAGFAGQLAWKNSGYDLLYTDTEGQMNSFFLNQENLQRWSLTNISTEVSNYIEAVDKELYKYTNLVNFSDFTLQTSNPYYTERLNSKGEEILSHAFKGFLVLSRQNQSGLKQAVTPVWAGLWTGINPIFTVEIGGNLYTLSDDNGQNVLYITEPKQGNDVYRGKEKLIRSRVTFGHFKFQDNGIQDKVFKSIDISAINIESDLRFLAEFKPSSSETWNRVASKVFKKEDCFKCLESVTLSDKGGALRNYKFSVSVDGTCPKDFSFRSADIRLTFEGLWRLRDFRLKAEAIPDKDTLEFNNPDITPENDCEEIQDYNLYRTYDDKLTSEFLKKYITCTSECESL